MMINYPQFKNNLCEAEIAEYKKLIDEQNEKNARFFPTLTKEEILEEIEANNRWINWLAEAVPNPKYIILKLMEENNIDDYLLSQMSGISLLRLRRIIRGTHLNIDDCRRLSIAFRIDEESTDYGGILQNANQSFLDWMTKDRLDPGIEEADIYCNMCGKSLKGIQGQNNGLCNASVAGGYDSEYLDDMVVYEFSMCECCLEKLFFQFKNPPTLKDNRSGQLIMGEK